MVTNTNKTASTSPPGEVTVSKGGLLLAWATTQRDVLIAPLTFNTLTSATFAVFVLVSIEVSISETSFL